VHHNHLGVDAALSLFPFGSEGFCRVRERIWTAAFEEAAAAQRSFVFTFAPERTVRSGLVRELASVVERVPGKVMFVELRCRSTELERRMEDPERARHGKLRSAAEYRELKAAGAFVFEGVPPADVSIATDELSPSQAAREIESVLPLTRSAC
jgi:hypothetical protein